jgi:hypothetical protein
MILTLLRWYLNKSGVGVRAIIWSASSHRVQKGDGDETNIRVMA